jgi:hypothetical protein
MVLVAPIRLAHALPLAYGPMRLLTRSFLCIFYRTGISERLRTDSGQDPCHRFGMKKRNLIERKRTTIASVTREMQIPRMTESVRNELRDHPEQVVEEPPARPEKV